MLTDDHQNDVGDWFLKIIHRLSKTWCEGTRMGPKRVLGGGGTVGWGLAGDSGGDLIQYGHGQPPSPAVQHCNPTVP
jgi:hypothetical protein